MFCTNCGKELNDNADVCMSCGKFVKKLNRQTALPDTRQFMRTTAVPTAAPEDMSTAAASTAMPTAAPSVMLERDKKTNSLAIVGFALALASIILMYNIDMVGRLFTKIGFTPIILLAAAAVIVSAISFKNVKKQGNFGFSLAGTIISGISLLSSPIAFIIFALINYTH